MLARVRLRHVTRDGASNAVKAACNKQLCNADE